MIVVDASLAFKWFVEETDSAPAIQFASRHDLIAPSLLRSELANALWKKVLRDEVSAEGARASLNAIDAFIGEWIELAELTREAFDIAAELRHPVYDCYYLALARRRMSKLATADERFAARCASSGFASLLIQWRSA